MTQVKRLAETKRAVYPEAHTGIVHK